MSHANTTSAGTSATFRGAVLVVEDNVIIAMDAEEVVLSLGATAVHCAVDVAQARDMLANEDILAAILDFNLEGETSEPVADALMERGVPFVFATGYSGLEVLPERFAHVTLLEKPYTADDIASAFAKVLAPVA